jgi:hypothetical protein
MVRAWIQDTIPHSGHCFNHRECDYIHRLISASALEEIFASPEPDLGQLPLQRSTNIKCHLLSREPHWRRKATKTIRPMSNLLSVQDDARNRLPHNFLTMSSSVSTTPTRHTWKRLICTLVQAELGHTPMLSNSASTLYLVKGTSYGDRMSFSWPKTTTKMRAIPPAIPLQGLDTPPLTTTIS